jgi:hypothetical protein
MADPVGRLVAIRPASRVSSGPLVVVVLVLATERHSLLLRELEGGLGLEGSTILREVVLHVLAVHGRRSTGDGRALGKCERRAGYQRESGCDQDLVHFGSATIQEE